MVAILDVEAGAEVGAQRAKATVGGGMAKGEDESVASVDEATTVAVAHVVVVGLTDFCSYWYTSAMQNGPEWLFHFNFHFKLVVICPVIIRVYT